MISGQDKLRIAFCQAYGHWGERTQLSQELGIGRSYFYLMAARVQQQMSCNVRALEATLARQTAQLAQLQEELSFCWEEIGRLEQERKECVLVDAQRIENFIWTAAVLGNSYRDTSELMEVAFDRFINKDKVGERVQEGSGRAQQVFVAWKPELAQRIQRLAADEIFMGPGPVLAGVDPISMTWALVQRAEHRDAATWQPALEAFPQLEYVVSDRARGIEKAVDTIAEAKHEQGKPFEHQHDTFHFQRDNQKVLRRMETSCYRKLNQLEERKQKLQAMERRGKNRQGYATQRCRLEKKAEQALQVFDHAEAAVDQIHQALELFDAQGQRRTRAQAEAEIRIAVQTLERLEDKNLQPIIQQSQNPKLLTFLSWTEARLGQLGLPTEVLQALCFLWFFQHREKVSKYLAAKYIQTLCWLQAQPLPRPLAELYRAVDPILSLVVRASSLIESLNSRLRLYQQNKKHVSEEFLYLCAVYFNLHPFRAGVRGGRAPLELLGMVPAGTNWLDVLRSVQPKVSTGEPP